MEMNDEQTEFLFAAGPAPEFHLPDPRSNFYEEVAALWHVPVGQVAHVGLDGHSMSDLQGRIEFARAPELPLDRREALALRIGTIEFSSRQIVSWSLV
jgi:hypothetical protein